MSLRILVTLIGFALCVPCFAESDSSEEMPSVPELIKKMYDYRMAIKNMQAKVTVTRPKNTRQPIRETETQQFYFVLDEGCLRCDLTQLNSKSSLSWISQNVSTPDFYFARHPHGTPEVNDGNSLFLNKPLSKPLETLDPRRIGTDLFGFDSMYVNPFNYDNILNTFYSPRGENFAAELDQADGETLYKISYVVKSTGLSASYWLHPQKGHNLVRAERRAPGFVHNYRVTLAQYPSKSGSVWFPKQIECENKTENDTTTETACLTSVVFDEPNNEHFMLKGLGIPIGYRVEYFDEGGRFWDGKELVGSINYEIQPANFTRRQPFLIVNAVGFAIVAIIVLIQLLRSRNRKQ